MTAIDSVRIIPDGADSFCLDGEHSEQTTVAWILRGSEHVTGLGLGAVEEIASGSLGKDKGGYRTEFIELCKQARKLDDDRPRRER